MSKIVSCSAVKMNEAGKLLESMQVPVKVSRHVKWQDIGEGRELGEFTTTYQPVIRDCPGVVDYNLHRACLGIWTTEDGSENIIVYNIHLPFTALRMASTEADFINDMAACVTVEHRYRT